MKTYSKVYFFAVSIFDDIREVANSAKIKPIRKIPDIQYQVECVLSLYCILLTAKQLHCSSSKNMQMLYGCFQLHDKRMCTSFKLSLCHTTISFKGHCEVLED